MDLMNRLIRGLPEPESGDDATPARPITGREWFDRVVLGREAEPTEANRDTE